MAAFGRAVPPEKRSLIFGIATAASSFGQFVFAPISQGFITRLRLAVGVRLARGDRRLRHCR